MSLQYADPSLWQKTLLFAASRLVGACLPVSVGSHFPLEYPTSKGIAGFSRNQDLQSVTIPTAFNAVGH